MTEIKRITDALIERTNDQETLEFIMVELLWKCRELNSESLTYGKAYGKLVDTLDKLYQMGAVNRRGEEHYAYTDPYDGGVDDYLA